jgi:hypothetical protein
MTEALLADKGRLGLTDARFFLAARSRLLTPLGAAEYLNVKRTHPHAWDGRVKVCLDVMGLYREMFPKQYAASRSPHFSTAREHEFYRLVNAHLFPLCVGGDLRREELEVMIAHDPSFFLPVIPVAGTQQHDWRRGCCPFQKLQTVFKLALVLAGHPLARREAFAREYELEEEPSTTIGIWGWQQFLVMCGVHDAPLRFLPLAFDLICYSTQTPWLDIPPDAGPVGFEWGREHVAKLFLARRKAESINSRVLALDGWLDESPAERVGHAVKLWNAMSSMEERSGYAGMSAMEIMEAMR